MGERGSGGLRGEFLVLAFRVETWDCVYGMRQVIEGRMKDDKPRNHLDFRSRLDSKGQRQGKVIAYRGSDVWVTEVLEVRMALMGLRLLLFRGI